MSSAPSPSSLQAEGEEAFRKGAWKEADKAFREALSLATDEAQRSLLAQWLRKCECELKAAAGETPLAVTDESLREQPLPSPAAPAPAPAPPPAASSSEAPTPPQPSPAPKSAAKKAPKDWDALARALDEEEAAEASTGGGDAALNKLFQSIYAKADDDTRRAMQKSYVESNGTCLSTDWKTVGAGKVETKPPDGQMLVKPQ